MKKYVLGLLLIALSSVSFAPAQMTAPKSKAEVVTVVNKEGKSFEFTAADLAKLPRQQLTAKDHDGKDVKFEGVAASEVLKLAGVKLGGGTMRGKRIAEYLLVEAKDNYRAVFSLTEFDPDFTDTVILLADKADGKALTEKDAPWQLVGPDQKKHARWVRQVIRLSVRTAGPEAIASSSSNDLTIQEFLFRSLIKRWTPANQKPINTFCLSVNGKNDPEDDLITKLSDLGNNIKKLSSCTVLPTKERNRVIDKDTNSARILFVAAPVWVNSDEVKVAAGSYFTNMDSDSCTYTLKRVNGQWSVDKKEMCVVS